MKTQNTIFSLLMIFALGVSTHAMDQKSNKYLELDSITYLEEDEVTDLNFDTEGYLPEGFNAYAAPENILHVSYIENQQEVALGFDPENYLPHDYNPYKYFFYIHSIKYIEDQGEMDFDIEKSLPKKFDMTIGR